VYETIAFGSQNLLKLTYVHIRFQKFFPGLYPEPPLKRRGAGKGGERKRVGRSEGGETGRAMEREGGGEVKEETEVWEGRERGMYASIHQRDQRH
jgi:hypothetical protein